MTIIKYLAVTLFLIAVPIALIGTSTRVVINSPTLYAYGFDKYDISRKTGIERSDLLYAARQIREYFGSEEQYLDLRVFVNGIRRNLFNEREVIHMRDVKNLVVQVYRVQELSLSYITMFSVIGLVLYRRHFFTRMGACFAIGGATTLGLIAVAIVASTVSFETVFLIFHMVSFSNDYWQLDPRYDYLIAIFPQGFFLDATLAIATITVLAALIIVAIPGYFLRSLSRSPMTPSSRANQQDSDSVSPNLPNDDTSI